MAWWRTIRLTTLDLSWKRCSKYDTTSVASSLSWRTKMAKRKKRTPEERAAEQARYDDLTRRLEAAIERRKRAAEGRRAAGESA
jgi:hypothetical protein